MGITIHYRGKIDDVEQIESLEDCVIDLVLALGGQVQLWQSFDENHSERVVRGLLIELDPGQETLSLLFSPEGYLIPLIEIEASEKNPLSEAPWCFIKTQFGSVEGHAALVELLSELKRRFLFDLEVSDESEYWSHRDPLRLATAIQQNEAIIRSVAEGLREFPLSDEASEDAEIVARRIQRIAEQVHESFKRTDATASAHAENIDEFGAQWQELEAHDDRIYREGVARSLRLQRRIETRLQAGDTPEDALRAAFDELDAQRETSEADIETDSMKPDRVIDEGDDLLGLEEPWHEETLNDIHISGQPDEAQPHERDELLERATQLYLEILSQADRDSDLTPTTVLHSAGKLCGGLAQVFPLPPIFEMAEEDRRLAAVQLKRALRGAAFLRGALLNRLVAKDASVRSRFLEEVESVQSEMVDLLRELRCR